MRASATVSIDRPIDDVFAFVADAENMPRWVDNLGETRLESGDGTAVGDRYASSYTYGGSTHDMTFEVTAYEPPTRVGLRGRGGPFDFDATVTLEATDGGTLVTNSVVDDSERPLPGVLMTVLGPVFRRFLARQLRGELDQLRTVLEAEDAPAEQRDSGTVQEPPT